MAGKERMSLGFDDDLDLVDASTAGSEIALAPLDPSGFEPVRRPKVSAPALSDAMRVAEEVGFRSRERKPRRTTRAADPNSRKPDGKRTRPAATPAREPAEPAGGRIPIPVEAPRPPVRRRRTGRNVQFNMKARAETIAAFTAIANARDWGFGETLERGVVLLEEAYGPKRD